MRLPGVLAGIAAALLLATGVAAAFADSTLTTTSDTTTVLTTTTAPTTTAPVTTTPTAPTTTTTTPATTTAAPTTTTAPVTTTATSTPTQTTTTATRSTTTTAAPATTAVATPTYQLAPAASCPIGGVVLLQPGRAPSVVGATADARVRTAQFGNLVAPADRSIVTASAVSLRVASCKRGRPTTGTAQLRSVSLFGGLVRAAQVTLDVGRHDAASIGDLTVNGKPVSSGAATRVALQSWGYLVAGKQASVQVSGGLAIAALSIHLVQTHSGLPAGTTILVAVAGQHPKSARAAAKAHTRTHASAHRRKKRKAASHNPLTITPPLGDRHYVFPVVGAADYGDTYGAFRGDVPGNWHHGDDIFAPLGTPVVAVAGGTINRVGWEKLGGWRLWVRDGVGDEFYYAHLSGYAPSDLHSNRVKAGQVLGFIGNTGDAFTTTPHLHFEIHPRRLLHLGYDGAVDPTTYLESWTRLDQVDAPRPIHPPLPEEPALRNEARYVFRELLAARHLIRRAPKPSQRPRVHIPAGAGDAPIAAPPPIREAAPAAAMARKSGTSTTTLVLLAALGLLVLAAAGAAAASAPVRARFRPRDPADAEPEPPVSSAQTDNR